METFLTDFSTTLMFGGIIGLILVGACYLAEKCGLTDKLANMFNDNSEEDE